MKKIIVLFIFANLCLPSFSKTTTNLKPTFKEFCPEIYYHKSPIDENLIEPAKLSTSKKALYWVSPLAMPILAFVTYPTVISDTKWKRKQRSKEYINSYNSALQYWKQREQSFNQSLAICDASKDKVNCYLQVKMNEEQKNLIIEQNEILKGLNDSINTLVFQQSVTNTNLNNVNNSIKQQNIHIQNTNMQLNNINSTLNRW